MKRPTEFWAAVALAGVIAYMTHDAYALNTVWEQPQICRLSTDWPCLEHTGC